MNVVITKMATALKTLLQVVKKNPVVEYGNMIQVCVRGKSAYLLTTDGTTTVRQEVALLSKSEDTDFLVNAFLFREVVSSLQGEQVQCNVGDGELELVVGDLRCSIPIVMGMKIEINEVKGKSINLTDTECKGIGNLIPFVDEAKGLEALKGIYIGNIIVGMNVWSLGGMVRGAGNECMINIKTAELVSSLKGCSIVFDKSQCYITDGKETEICSNVLEHSFFSPIFETLGIGKHINTLTLSRPELISALKSIAYSTDEDGIINIRLVKNILEIDAISTDKNTTATNRIKVIDSDISEFYAKYDYKKLLECLELMTNDNVIIRLYGINQKILIQTKPYFTTLLPIQMNSKELENETRGLNDIEKTAEMILSDTEIEKKELETV